MKKIIIATAVAGLMAIAPAVFAQSTVTGTLSSGGSSSSGGSGSLTGTTGSGSSLSGSVGSGNSLTGTVTSPSSSSGGGSTGSNGPPAGGGGGGGGVDTTIICPNLPDSLYTLPAGYEIVDGDCDPIGTTTTTPGIPNTGTTAPGIPNTGAGGNAAENLALLFGSAISFFGAGALLLRKYAIRY